jgi:hypothetical protein
MIRRRPWTLCLVLTLAAGLAGCVFTRPAGSSADPFPAPPTFSATLDASATDLATHSGAWPHTQELLEKAVNLLNQKCLVKQGFEYPGAAAPSLLPPEDEAANIDLPGRRDHGYGLAPSSKPDSGNHSLGSPADLFYTHLSPQEQRRFDVAIFGPAGKVTRVDLPGGNGYVLIKESGCEADGRRILIGDVVQWARVNYVAEQFSNRLADQASTSPRYLSAMAVWQSCMIKQGYRYETPDTARKWLATKYQQETPTAALRQREISIAVADGECAMQTHLPSIALQVRRNLATSLPENDRRTLSELATYRAAAVKHAIEMLGKR